METVWYAVRGAGALAALRRALLQEGWEESGFFADRERELFFLALPKSDRVDRVAGEFGEKIDFFAFDAFLEETYFSEEK
ncbi:MAG: hypothetical protein IJR89_03235 [Clostridia bacterium]|nr:hypothetical protein [Clostridia bacterium]